MHSLVIHYHRLDHQYLDWDLWVWPSSTQSQLGGGYDSQYQDEFGVVFQVSVPAELEQIGFLIRRGSTHWLQKEGEQDRYIQLLTPFTEIWVAEKQSQLFYTLAEARTAVFPFVTKAYLDTPTLVLLRLFEPYVPNLLNESFWVKDLITSHKWLAKPVPLPSPTNSMILMQLLLPEEIDVTHPCVITGAVSIDTTVIPRRALDDDAYFYAYDDLGCVCQPTSSHFRVWAPTASQVTLLIYNSEAAAPIQETPMKNDQNGTWVATLLGNWHGFYYLYQLEIHQITTLAVDPYAKALAADRSRAMIVDLARTNPPAWDTDRKILLERATDAIIYETHLRDFSAHSSSGAIHPGKYLQFNDHHQRSTDGLVSGLEHLLELGITHVQLLPIAEFGRFEEKNPDEYNWGYDPRFYLVPEGRYASNRSGIERIYEFKQMIYSLHQHGLGVILDVVFNHSFHTTSSSFHKIVPEYYFRTDEEGHYTNGAGVGNELATERPMVQKFVKDALIYWLTEFHVDGFRFDLMALIGKSSMMEIVNSLRQLRPDVLLYGEPWAAGPSGIFGDDLLLKGDQQHTGLAVFNDQLRDALVGSVFDRNNTGYVTGQLATVHDVKKGVVGSIAYQGVWNDFAASPSETVNYASCHDNWTLWDRIHISDPWETEHVKITMDLLAQAIIFTSQGIPFMQSGEEFLRTKHGKDNTYLAGDDINALDWHRKLEYFHVFSYYKGLIRLRKSHPAFRMSDAAQVNEHLEFVHTSPPLLAWILKDHANGDDWKHILVIVNPLRTVTSMWLPDGTWTIVVNKDQAGVIPLGFADQQTEILPLSCQILYQ